MENAELKNCPFCGGDAELFTFQGRTGQCWVVKCGVCLAQGKIFSNKDDESRTETSKRRAITAWNRRVDADG